MKKIDSAVIMSDLHLGCDKSYFFMGNKNYQKNRDAIVEFLGQFKKPDELILNGDIIELSLASWETVCDATREFFSIITEVWILERIVYVPGNHDHHFWREMAEQIFVFDQIKRGEKAPCHQDFLSLFVDKKFSSKINEHKKKNIFEALWPAKKKLPEFVVKYPHHLFEVKSGVGDMKRYLITHGHFLEKLFRPINLLIDPARIEELEAFNNIWLEAFDYHLGHAGKLTKTSIKLLKGYEKGGPKARKEINRVLNQIYTNLQAKIKMCFLKAFLLKACMKLLAKKIPTEKKAVCTKNR